MQVSGEFLNTKVVEVKKVTSFLAGLFLVASAVFASGSSEAAGTGSAGPITLYTSVPQNIADKIQSDFEAKNPDIKLDVFRSGTGAVVTKLMTEKAAGDIRADLIWVADPSTYEGFKQQNMLLEFTPAEAASLPSSMKDPDGYYYAGRLINMIIGYNTSEVTTPPKTWKELLSEEYRGKVGMATPLSSGAALAAAATLADKYGWQYFKDFHANGGAQEKSNGSVRDLIASGELKAGIVLDYMMRTAKSKGSPVDYVWPSDGAVFIPSPIAILAASKHPGAAKSFVGYVLSKSGQQTMVELGDFIPVRADVQPPDGAPGLSSIEKLPTNWKQVSADTDKIKSMWTSIFGG